MQRVTFLLHTYLKIIGKKIRRNSEDPLGAPVMDNKFFAVTSFVLKLIFYNFADKT